MKPVAVIYHSADFDGIYSGKVCEAGLKKSGYDVEMYGWDYGQRPPNLRPFSDYAQIYVVDLSLDEWFTDPHLAEQIVWIDHHASAIKKYKDIKFMAKYAIDGVAACRLCWQWFNTTPVPQSAKPFIDRQVVEPGLITLLGEHDIWDHADPDSASLQYGLRAAPSWELDNIWNEALKKKGFGNTPHLDKAIKDGQAIECYVLRANQETLNANACIVEFEGLRFLALNTPVKGSQQFESLTHKVKHDALLKWNFDGRVVQVSLYHSTNTEIDLSVIAAKHGGGGHKGACGFRLPLSALTTLFQFQPITK